MSGLFQTSVLFHCPCYKSPADRVPQRPDTGDSLTSTNLSSFDDEVTQLVPGEPRVSYSLYPIEDLYFCDDCYVHRCPRCVMEEVVSLFCPDCLFEVPLKSSSSSSNCPRNCFRCPLCEAALQTRGTETKGYELRCNYCDYTTRAQGLFFARSGGLGSQIASQKANNQETAFAAAAKKLEADQTALEAEFESEGTRLLRQYRSAMSPQNKANAGDVEVVADVEAPEMVEEDINALLLRDTIDISSTLRQRQRQRCATRLAKEDLLPVSTALRTKRTKRCRQCRSLLVKPDPKPMSISFRSRLYANRILPTIEFTPSKSAQLIPHITSQWVLKLTNPLAEACTFTLSTANKTEQGDQVVILCPQLTIGPTSEVWEESAAPIKTSSAHGEIHEAGRNFASVILEIVAAPRQVDQHKSSGELEILRQDEPIGAVFSVFVQMLYEMDSEDPVTSETTRMGETRHRIKKELGFWIVLKTEGAD